MKARNIMRHPRFRRIPSRFVPFVALLAATTLGGCIGYTEYPSRGYGYNYSSGDYADYPRTYSASYTSYGYRPYYAPDYRRYNDTNEGRGRGSN